MAQYRGVSSEGLDLIARALLEVSELDQEGYDRLYFYSEEDIPTTYYTLDEGEITQERAEILSEDPYNYTVITIDILPSTLVANTIYITPIQNAVSFRQALLMTEHDFGEF